MVRGLRMRGFLRATVVVVLAMAFALVMSFASVMGSVILMVLLLVLGSWGGSERLEVGDVIFEMIWLWRCWVWFWSLGLVVGSWELGVDFKE